MPSLGPSHLVRVVALVGPATPLSLPVPWVVVRAVGGYEAAAELLAGAAAALLVDLSRLTAAHVGLLELAARRGVGIVAYGTIAASLPPGLSLRLVTPQDLPAALAEAVALANAPAPAGDERPAAQDELPAADDEELAGPTDDELRAEIEAELSQHAGKAPDGPPAPEPPSAASAEAETPRPKSRLARRGGRLSRADIQAMLEDS